MLVMSVALPPMRQVTAIPSLLDPVWLWLAAGLLVASLLRAAVERLATA
ncbi:hypothetical protein PC120_g28240 [Phytophthora cactorum]|nr:hypothetical protein PC120_g28240 [Phytophthora cactorum]